MAKGSWDTLTDAIKERGLTRLPHHHPKPPPEPEAEHPVKIDLENIPERLFVAEQLRVTELRTRGAARWRDKIPELDALMEIVAAVESDAPKVKLSLTASVAERLDRILTVAAGRARDDDERGNAGVRDIAHQVEAAVYPEGRTIGPFPERPGYWEPATSEIVRM